MRKLAKLATVVLATSAIACAVWALVPVVARAALPYQIDYEEGNILNAAVRLLHGLSPYPDPHTLPSVINPYGPVLYLVEALLVKVFGVTFFPGRLLVILCGVAIAILIGAILRGETKSLAIAVAFGASFLCSPFVQFWWPSLRVDLVGLALTLAGLWVFNRYPRRTWPAALLFVLAIYTKHTLIAAPASCMLWSLLSGQKRAAARLLSACFVLGAIGLVIAEIWTHGVFAFALFLTHPDPYLWSEYPSALRQVAEQNVILVLLAIVLLVRDVQRRKASLALVYLVLSAIAVLTIGKAGSNSNHLLELMAALCLAAGAGWSYLSELSGVRELIPVTIALLLAGQIVDRSRELQFEARNSSCEQAIVLIRQERGPYILSENTGAVVLAGKTPLVSNPFVYTQLVKYAGWHDDDLVNILKQHRVSLVLIDASRRQLWSPAFMRTLHENYRLSKTFDCRYAGLAFVPNGT